MIIMTIIAIITGELILFGAIMWGLKNEDVLIAFEDVAIARIRENFVEFRANLHEVRPTLRHNSRRRKVHIARALLKGTGKQVSSAKIPSPTDVKVG